MSQLMRLTNKSSNEGLENFYVGDFGDKRINVNIARAFKYMNEKETIVVKELGGNRAREKSLWRALSNAKVQPNLISKNLAVKTNENCRNVEHVLVPFDTVEITYPEQPIKKELFGYTTNTDTKGLFLHGSTAINASNAEVLGLSSVLVWTREQCFEKGIKDKDRTIEEKESSKWHLAAQETKENLPAAKMLTMVGDRESDNIEYYVRTIDERTHVISRAKSDRRLSSGENISEKLIRLEKSYQHKILLPITRERKVARNAEFEIKFCKVKIGYDDDKETNLTMYCVQALEIGEVPEGDERVSWVLLTSHKITTLSKALEILKWYSWRWVVEDVHRLMKKQGMKIESSQCETPHSLSNLAVLSYATAINIMVLIKARDGGKQDAKHYFDKQELSHLKILSNKLAGSTEKQQNPHKICTMGWAAWVIARLGGWNCYGAKPGPAIMIRGYRSFKEISKYHTLLSEKNFVT